MGTAVSRRYTKLAPEAPTGARVNCRPADQPGSSVLFSQTRTVKLLITGAAAAGSCQCASTPLEALIEMFRDRGVHESSTMAQVLVPGLQVAQGLPQSTSVRHCTQVLAAASQRGSCGVLPQW